MATRWKAGSRLSLLSMFLLCCIFISVNCKHNRRPGRSVRTFSFSVVDDELGEDVFSALVRRKRDAAVVTDTDTESEKKDAKCEAQKSFFSEARSKLKNGERLEETYVFTRETKFNLALAWAGLDDDGTLLVLTTDDVQKEHAVSTLWRSTDHGRTWVNWNSHVENKVFRKDDGLQRNPHNPKKAYLISYEHFIYLTEDGGNTWRRSDLPSSDIKQISVDEQLEFHPEEGYENYVAVISNDKQLYVTYNNFNTSARSIKTGVQKVKWGTAEAQKEKCLYATTKEVTNNNGPDMMALERYDSETSTWKTLLTRVVLFNVEDKFIYASIFKSENPKNQDDARLMMISTDGGDSWNEAQLPTLTGDRFFSVLDMSEGLIFMHVDNPGDTGHGTLYTSSSNGIVYSVSLKNHLFPNYNTIHDFIKVESIRGVYLASQMGDDKSIHTMITYNRGADWKQIQRPDNVECQDREGGCYLQIHNAYSIHRGIKARPPLSQKGAYGLVLVHAHVASNLQKTPPDVFLSSDGGYTFKRVLRGPHHYEIADSGGLLVAVPMNTDYPKVVKFSTDEGNCWHTYNFTSDEIKFTGLLTEPGGKSMTVGLWGYHKDSKKWTVSVINFSKVVTTECKEADYMAWTPHSSLTANPGSKGCLLGKKETFMKVIPESWCRNGYFKKQGSKTEICNCTEEDYECDYGFYRPGNSLKCVRQPEIRADQIDICKGGHLDKLKTVGYRLIPGDVCKQETGFNPPSSEVTELEVICNVGDQQAIHHNLVAPNENSGSSAGSGKLVVAVVIVTILLLVSSVGAFFVYKMVLLRRHRVVYRYSMLSQADDRDNEFENALTTHDTLYNESSDDEVEQDNHAPKRNGAVPGSKSRNKMHVSSYHDDSDEDMLG
ncbi:hypothetical protein BsWGS_13727 [Bradybaena similaris]